MGQMSKHLLKQNFKCREINSRITEMFLLRVDQYMVTKYRHERGWVQELPSWIKMMGPGEGTTATLLP